MDRIIPAHLRSEVFIYLDDLLIISDTFERHTKVVCGIALALEKAGLTINVQKSPFCVPEVHYLGHIVGHGIISMDAVKIETIKDYPTPQLLKQLRRFVGITGWYKKSIENYAAITSPLTDSLKKKKVFFWSSAAEQAFQDLKAAMSKAPVLHMPDFTQPFFIHCDASHTRVGGVLMQINPLFKRQGCTKV